MSNQYSYSKPVRRSRYGRFRRVLIITLIIIAILLIIALFIINGLRNGQKPPPAISSITNSVVSSDMNTFIGPYFKFKDTGKWVLDQKDSTSNKFLYIKYRSAILEGQLVIYINQQPIPLYLSTSRVLGVRLVNDNSFQVTGISDPCRNQYKPGELHRVKELSVDDAIMLCDPDTPDYSVVISEISGDYRLNLTRPNGQKMQYIITYLNQTQDPNGQSLLNIASSFQTL